MKLTLLAGYSVVIFTKTKKGSNYKSFLCYVREKVKVDVESEKKTYTGIVIYIKHWIFDQILLKNATRMQCNCL